MDFIKIKKIIIFVLALPALYLIASNMSLIFNRPDIKNLNVPNMADISFNSNSKELISNTEAINNIPSFGYQLIGYRSGKNDSSVILKKGNKEYVVAKGEKLEGTYELIEVTKDEVIFRNKEKLYRIENRVGNNL
jgi:type II secretory pathway component PulC